MSRPMAAEALPRSEALLREGAQSSRALGALGREEKTELEDEPYSYGHTPSRKKSNDQRI